MLMFIEKNERIEPFVMPRFLIIGAFCNKLAFFVIPAAICNKFDAIRNKKAAAFCNKILPRFVIQKLPRFVIRFRCVL